MFSKKTVWFMGYAHLFYSVILITTCFAQYDLIKKDQYQIGPDERLLITVHIWGEVRNPGGYLVPDDTNILELISKAGGPTEFSNLSNVKITRGLTELIDYLQTATGNEGSKSGSKSMRVLKDKDKQVIQINLKKMLDKETYQARLPTLQPGDVVRISRNAWFTWQAVIRVVSQVAIVVQVWYWYSRIE